MSTILFSPSFISQLRRVEIESVAQSIETGPVDFETQPSDYKHWKLEVDGDRARLTMDVQEEEGLRSDYVLKLNSYDLGVDIELADAIQRLRFEHPRVRCVVLDGSLDRVFCAGANILMLRSSTHGFKVNFCKFTNETRLYIEDSSANSGLRWLAACNGAASGGGYELALAADRILLVDDRSSAVSFPETPLLGVLPGTGGLTRLVDKRKVRRDRADVFSTVAEGVKGKRALNWGLVDAIAPLSKFDEEVTRLAGELADEVPDKSDREGISLDRVGPTREGKTHRYRHVTLELMPESRTAELTIEAPADAAVPATGDEARALGSDWWIFRAFRELDHALLELRLNHADINLVLVKTRGGLDSVLAADRTLEDLKDHWFVGEVRHQIKRVLKRLDITAKSLFAIADEGSCFAGTFLELGLAADRIFTLKDPDFPVSMASSALNAGIYPMANGLSRLETRFLGEPERGRRRARGKGALRRRARRRARPVHRGAGRARLGRRAPRRHRGARELLAGRPHRHGGQSSLRRTRNRRDQDLRSLERLAELDLPASERRGRARSAHLLRNSQPTRIRFHEDLIVGINYSEKIPNNVDLSSDRRLQRALEKWQPAYLDWWAEAGPTDFNRQRDLPAHRHLGRP